MAIHFSTSTPKQLLTHFDARIAQKEPKGKITTWRKQDDFYTHTSDQWKEKAWLWATAHQGKLTFNIAPSKGATLTLVAYAYYHGHLIETFINHFVEEFSSGTATAKAESPDKVK